MTFTAPYSYIYLHTFGGVCVCVCVVSSCCFSFFFVSNFKFGNILKWSNSLVTRSFWQVNDHVFRLNAQWYSICTVSDVITDVNECESSPCLNGASCIDLDNGYRCQCIEGWQGDTCHQGKIISAHCYYFKLCTNKFLPVRVLEISCFTL